jgi:hypothetical protein
MHFGSVRLSEWFKGLALVMNTAWHAVSDVGLVAEESLYLVCEEHHGKLDTGGYSTKEPAMSSKLNERRATILPRRGIFCGDGGHCNRDGGLEQWEY